MSKSIKIVLSLLCFSFVAIISSFFLPLERSPLKGPLFMIFLFTPLPLGIIFLFQLKKTKLKAGLKKTLKITALSALALPLGGLLHNLFYALAMVSKNILILKIFFEALHVIFFILATLVSPLVFIISLIILLLKIFPKK